MLFLSTLSLRRATLRSLQRSSINFLFLSTLSWRRATVRCFSPAGCWRISIHALLAESDDSLTDDVSTGGNFYPRSPCGERLFLSCNYPFELFISIHALLAESDAPNRRPYHCNKKFLSTLSLRRATNMKMRVICTSINFYPRSPCGERRQKQHHQNRLNPFLSTLSLRRATICANNHIRIRENFYPRSPCGERQTLAYVSYS